MFSPWTETCSWVFCVRCFCVTYWTRFCSLFCSLFYVSVGEPLPVVYICARAPSRAPSHGLPTLRSGDIGILLYSNTSTKHILLVDSRRSNAQTQGVPAAE